MITPESPTISSSSASAVSPEAKASASISGRPRTLGEKLALATAGAGASIATLGGLPPAADAAVVAAQGIPVVPPPFSNTANLWDVDGDATIDFALVNYTSTSSTFAFFDDASGGRLVVPAAAGSDGIAKLPYGVAVGTSLAAAYKFHAGGQGYNKITFTGAIGADAFLGGWAFGDTGFFGFKFTNGTGTHFGWGEMRIANRGNPNFGDNFEILRAYYNDTANAPVMVGVVPEPTSASLLALGAAGLVLFRRKKAS